MVIILLAIISGVLYRIGGAGGFKNAKLVRRIGCDLVSGIALWVLGVRSWLLVPYLLLFYGALTTYHDYLNNGKENWLCWLVTGIVYGLSAFPLVWVGIPMWKILVRAVVLGILTMAVSEATDKDWLEEFSRGALIIITLPIL